ncbi:hypothetical protein P171DRAFT_519384 [Karstenula rhodostoma CBS 690.94]|uniref:Zn(2)-C6 fungal-type domain-containing protein n=1 Tax=Karstenula rhodostoma CBS 690.94 TaxID=1392251 RepID=A0A9P4PQJ1_9PLEO|nr:hypothetical protein P171DRAFT_519384 [Karstenula rhodostoma CBS 690.94]
MAASSQYHRGATAPHSHYHALPGNHEHLYADLATSWHGPHGAFSRAPAPSALLQRFSSPAQRAPAHYLDYAGSSDPVNPNLNQPPWPAAYTRPPAPEWNPDFNNASSLGSRSLSYGEADGRQQPVSLADPRPSRQYETAPTAPLSSPAHEYRPQDNHHEPHVTADSAVVPNAPLFPANARTLAPMLNYANSDMHVSPTHPSTQPAVTWAQEPHSDTSPVLPQHAFVQNSHALPQAVVLGSQAQLPDTTWAMVSAAPSAPAPAVYEQLPDTAPLWPVEPAPQEYAHQQHVLTNAALHDATPPRGKRSLIKNTVAKVPAAFVARSQKSKVSKRKGPLDEQARRKTHEMRKQKSACIRCRFYKSGCDHGDPCQKCQKVAGGARSFNMPCCRVRLEEAMLVRHCNGRSNQDEGEFIGYEWLPNWNLLNMDIIWNLPGTGPIQVQPMRIMIGQYRPKRPFLDAATNEWSTTQGRVVVEQPPYAVYDTQSLIFDRVSHDEIALLTYQEVVRLRARLPPGPQNLLDLCMRIQCLSVVSQGYGTVWSNDVPGILEYDYSKLGRSQYEAYDRNSRDRPLPGAINQQVDVAALKLLKKLETACHKLVNNKIFKPKIKPWYELFLALYVIFWNLEYIHQSAKTYILSKNGTTVESHVNNVVSRQIEKWEYSFEVLLTYWKTAIRDYVPFKVARENPEELRKKGHLDAQGFDYVMKLVSIIDRIGEIGQSTAPYTGLRSTHNSLSSKWIKRLMETSGA